MGAVAVGETPSLTGESVGGTHQALEGTLTHPPGNQHEKGAIHFWVAGEVTESWLRAKQVVLFPLRTLLNMYHHNTVKWVAPPR